MDLLFVLNSAALGVGLAMDAFSVSLANGLQEPKMRPGRMCGIAGTFAIFQILMAVIGIKNVLNGEEKKLPYIGG